MKPKFRIVTMSQLEAAGSWAPRDIMPEYRMPEIDERTANLKSIIKKSAVSLQRLTRARDMIKQLDSDVPTRDWIKQLRELLSDDHKAHKEATRAP
jgi:hypothetical protein